MNSLDIDTLFIGRNSFYFEEISSTNEWLMKENFQRQMAEGTIVFATDQKNGKGQRDNKWIAENFNSLTFSILLKPSFIKPCQAFDISICSALAINQCLNDLRPGFSIKWPNDIFFDDKKISGILIENQFRNNNYINAIVGIGLNINQKNFKDLPKAISLRQIIGVSFPPEKIMIKICELLEGFYLQLRAGNYKLLKERYILSLYGFGKWRFFKTRKTTFRGKIKNVLRSGHLQIESLDGSLQDFDIKQLKFL